MLHWTWNIAKRYPGRTLILGGPALMVAAAIHLRLIEEVGRDDQSFQLAITTVVMAMGDGVMGLIGYVLFAIGLWGVARRGR